MSTIHIHLHVDNTPTQELPAVDPEVPSCANNAPSHYYREVEKLKAELTLLTKKAAEQDAWIQDLIEYKNTTPDRLRKAVKFFMRDHSVCQGGEGARIWISSSEVFDALQGEFFND